MDKKVRGSTDLILAPEGRAEIRRVNRMVHEKRGCPDKLYVSTQSRAVESGYIAVKGCDNTTIMRLAKTWNRGT